MKSLIIFFLIILTVQVNGQRHDKFGDRPNKRMEELHKIKLIETLQMDEETTLKFFSRHSKHREQMRELDSKGDEILRDLEDKINSGNKEEINSLVLAYQKNEIQITEQRNDFINSLSDILTPAQIAKFLVFEMRFREEIRDIILKDRPRRGD